MTASGLIVLPPMTILVMGYLVGVLTGLIMALMNTKRGPHK